MKIFESILLVANDSENPGFTTDRDVKFAHGHVDKGEFAATVGAPLDKVAHAWSAFEDDEGTELGGAWDLEKTEDCPEPITLAFV